MKLSSSLTIIKNLTRPSYQQLLKQDNDVNFYTGVTNLAAVFVATSGVLRKVGKIKLSLLIQRSDTETYALQRQVPRSCMDGSSAGRSVMFNMMNVVAQLLSSLKNA